MSVGLIALLDDIAALAKLTAASLDDVAAQALRTSVKAAGVVIDDTAVTPRYVVGLAPQRELPIIGKIAAGSLRNKLLVLLPLCLLLERFAPFLVTPLLMIGGLYLCYEGAEKLMEALGAADEHEDGADGEPTSPDDLEKRTVSGAIRTDFILSAEIMTLSLASIELTSLLSQALVLALVGVVITAGVYGAVALIVKADDIGLAMARGATGLRRRFGCWLVRSVPVFLDALAVLGTAAMLWVGGNILVHGLASWGLGAPEHLIEGVGEHAASIFGLFPEAVRWLSTALVDMVIGTLVGGLLVLLLRLVLATGLFSARGASR